MFVGLVGDDEQVVGPRELGDVRQFGLVEDDAGRVVGLLSRSRRVFAVSAADIAATSGRRVSATEAAPRCGGHPPVNDRTVQVEVGVQHHHVAPGSTSASTAAAIASGRAGGQYDHCVGRVDLQAVEPVLVFADRRSQVRQAVSRGILIAQTLPDRALGDLSDLGGPPVSGTPARG